MERNPPGFRRIHRLFQYGLDAIEYIGLLVIAFATTWAGYHEVAAMVALQRVTLADLLLMFLYLEVLAMTGIYFKTGQLPVRFPLYIAMVAVARHIIIDMKELTESALLSSAATIVIISIAVLVVRYGHVRFPYDEDAEGPNAKKPYVRE